jgi:hypothetical protein
MKKILSFAAVVAFAIAVVSCGQSADNNAAETPATEETPAIEQDEVASDTLDTTMPEADTLQY